MKQKYPELTNIIRGAIKRTDMTDKEFSKMIGMSYQTLQIRWRDPGSWRFFEWGSVLRHISFLDDELKAIQGEIAK